MTVTDRDSARLRPGVSVTFLYGGEPHVGIVRNAPRRGRVKIASRLRGRRFADAFQVVTVDVNDLTCIGHAHQLDLFAA